MIIQPVANPTGSANTSDANAAADARARAIALISGQTPQVNQNNISPEEQGALKNNDTSVSSQSTAEATEAPSSEEKPLDPQYTALARKERALRARVAQQTEQLKAREAALSAREAEINAKSTQDLSNYIQKDKLKQNAFQVLSELGLTYDDITNQAVAQQSPEWQAFAQMKQEMQEELQKVREEQANTRKSYEQQQAQAYQQALSQIRNEARDLVKSDPSFEAIRATGSVNDVVELIERTFNEEGTLMTVEQAAQAVEDYLTEEATKLSKIEKIQKRLNAQTQSPNNSKQQPVATQQMKTLTNSVGAQRPLSARERALLAFKGELK